MANSVPVKTTNFKEIRAWRVLFLGVITFGIYSIVWLAKRRHESPLRAPAVTHWGWLVGVLGLALSGATILVFMAPFVAETARAAAELTVYVGLAIGVLVTVAGTAWTALNAQLISRALSIRRPSVVVVLLALCFMPALVTYQQLAVNHAQNPQRGNAAHLTQQFAWLAVIGVVVGAAATVGMYASYSIEQEIDTLRQDYEEVYILTEQSNEYVACVEQLEIDYPEDEPSEAEYAAYESDAAVCDELYEQLQ